MKSKIKERELAVELRKTGHSLSEISNKLKISKSSASIWTRNLEMNQKAKKRIVYLQKMATNKAVKINP